ncbi:hypothetical protein [Coralloluteibacterium thermophilus]|uniref:Uncharacterized protein n=1 Tax=Coralloluteibacterium thermophilum TaxID=2707049 RepID=A0ABV9NN72_9GAMM
MARERDGKLDPTDTHAAPLRQRDETDVTDADRDLDRFGRAADADDREAQRAFGDPPKGGLGGDETDRAKVRHSGMDAHGERRQNEDGPIRGIKQNYGGPQDGGRHGAEPSAAERRERHADPHQDMRGGALHDYDAEK